jgi:hypothetical protein
VECTVLYSRGESSFLPYLVECTVESIVCLTIECTVGGVDFMPYSRVCSMGIRFFCFTVECTVGVSIFALP